MRKRIFSFFSIGILTAAFGVVVNAQDVKQEPTTGVPQEKRAEKPFRKGFGKGEGFRRGRMHGRKMAGLRLMRGINLSDAQKQQIRAIMEANRPTQENKERIRSLFTAKRNGTITPEQEAELRQIREAARQRSEAVRAQIQAVLTEEQKAEIERRKQEWRERRQNRRNKPGNPVVNN